MEAANIDSLLLKIRDGAVAAMAGDDKWLRQSDFFSQLQEITRPQGSEFQANLLRALMCEIIRDNEEKIDQLNYPNSVLELIKSEFVRITGQLSDDDEYFDLDHMAMRNDFRIVSFSRIPAGVEHFELSRLPRRASFRGGFAQSMRFISILRQAGGMEPFYQVHISDSVLSNPFGFLRAYRPAAREQAHRNIAASLEKNPQVHGLVTGSWWFDPQLGQVTPSLSRFGDHMLENGAFLMRCGPDASSLKNALTNSQARQKLYAEGKYVPETYFIIWPRDALITWARQTEGQ